MANTTWYSHHKFLLVNKKYCLHFILWKRQSLIFFLTQCSNTLFTEKKLLKQKITVFPYPVLTAVNTKQPKTHRACSVNDRWTGRPTGPNPKLLLKTLHSHPFPQPHNTLQLDYLSVIQIVPSAVPGDFPIPPSGMRSTPPTGLIKSFQDSAPICVLVI